MKILINILISAYILFSIGYTYSAATDKENPKYWDFINKLALIFVVIISPIILPYIIGRKLGDK